jgi:hypothetical protein
VEDMGMIREEENDVVDDNSYKDLKGMKSLINKISNLKESKESMVNFYHSDEDMEEGGGVNITNIN